MNRRKWLGGLAALIPVGLLSKVTGNSIPTNDGKMGYVAVGCYDEHGKHLFDPSNIRVHVNGEKWDHDTKHIQRANDREGWIEYIDTQSWRRSEVRYTVHLKADVHLERITKPFGA